jgi:hypothetical protein
MIAFESPEGAVLRGLKPSRSATLAIWLAALETGRNDWADWARAALASASQDADLAALRFMQAVNDGDVKAARQLWTVLSSFPAESRTSRIYQAAQRLRSELTF